MLCAASMIFGLTSRRLLSTSLATKGKAAITSGTIEATEPIVVPTISLVSGNTTTIRIMNGTERRRLTMTLITFMSGRGSGSTPPLSPHTRSTPSGSPMMKAKTVATTVT